MQNTPPSYPVGSRPKKSVCEKVWIMIKATLKPNNYVTKCPECGNNTEFNAHSSQVAEDLCNVWVECPCGYDPTFDTNLRYEDVWGGIDEGTVRMALECWNDAIQGAIQDAQVSDKGAGEVAEQGENT